MDIKSVFGSVYTRITISLVLIVLLLKTQNLEEIKLALMGFDIKYFFLALSILMTGTLVSAFRWQTVLKSSETEVSAWILFSLYLKGYFYNNFLPTQFGGDVYKSIALGNKIKDQSLSLFSVFMDRFSGLLILGTIGLFGVAQYYGWYVLLGAAIVFVIGLMLYFPVLNFVAKHIKFFVKFRDASEHLARDKKRAMEILLFALGVQLLSYLFTYTLFLGFGISLSLSQVFAIFPITSLAALIPSFNGFGTQELVFSTLFPAISAIAIGVSLVTHAVRLVISLIGGVFILFNIGGKNIVEGDS